MEFFYAFANNQSARLFFPCFVKINDNKSIGTC